MSDFGTDPWVCVFRESDDGGGFRDTWAMPFGSGVLARERAGETIKGEAHNAWRFMALEYSPNSEIVEVTNDDGEVVAREVKPKLSYAEQMWRAGQYGDEKVGVVPLTTEERAALADKRSAHRDAMATGALETDDEGTGDE